MPFLEVNNAAAREHVVEIERDIQHIKDRVRCTTPKFPFKNIPTMVLIYTVYNVCLWLNAFHIWYGITGGFSPRELITGLTVNFKDHCKFDVRGYVEASTDAVIMNDKSDRTHACIFVGPSGNRQGSLNCFDLETGKVVVRRSSKQLFWPDRLLKKAEEWGKKGKSAVLRDQIKFLNRHGLKFDWDNDDLKEIKLSKTDEN